MTQSPNPNPQTPQSAPPDKKVVVGGAEFNTENYVGVSPEYQNYADSRHKPLAGEPEDDDDAEAGLVEAIKAHEEENTTVEGEHPDTNFDNLPDGRRAKR